MQGFSYTSQSLSGPSSCSTRFDRACAGDSTTRLDRGRTDRPADRPSRLRLRRAARGVQREAFAEGRGRRVVVLHGDEAPGLEVFGLRVLRQARRVAVGAVEALHAAVVRVDCRREVIGLDPGEQAIARAVGLVLRRIELAVDPVALLCPLLLELAGRVADGVAR